MNPIDVSEALKYICDHQFDLDPEMRKAVRILIQDPEDKRRELMRMTEWLENHILKVELIDQKLMDMRKRLNLEVNDENNQTELRDPDTNI